MEAEAHLGQQQRAASAMHERMLNGRQLDDRRLFSSLTSQEHSDGRAQNDNLAER